jgi:hypothetical protein
MRGWFFGLLAVMTASGATIRAHHSIDAVYDSTRQATVEGTVAEFQLINPHPFLLIDVMDRDGRTERWRLEMDNRSELAAIGVTARTFKAGDRVIVKGSAARSQARALYLLRLDRPQDGFWYEQVGSSPRIRKD